MEFFLTVTIVTENRKEVEELPSSAGPLIDTRMCNYNPRDGPAWVCVCLSFY